MSRKRNEARTLLLAVLAFVAFFSCLGRRQIVTSHEARVAQTARTMAAAGWPWNAAKVDVAPVKLVTDVEGKTALQPQWDAPPIEVNPWLVPVMAGEMRLQKPPLPYWCAAILYRLAGVEWNEALSRLVPAILGFLGTFLIGNLAKQTVGRAAAWPAGLVWVSSYFISEQYRLAMADPYLSFFTLLGMWAWVRGWVILFYIALGFGILSKGPLFVALGLGIVFYHLFFRRRIPGPWWKHVAGIVIVLAISLPWVIYVYRHVENVAAMWKYESVGELPGAGNEEKQRPIWFYLPGLFQITLPWTPVWVGAIALAFARRRWFAITWYFSTVLVFSVLTVKKNAYLLPVMPAQTLIVAEGLVYLLVVIRRFPKHAILAWVQAGIGICAGVAAGVLCAWKLSGSDRIVGLVVAVAAVAAAWFAISALRRQKGTAWAWCQAASFVLAVVAIEGMVVARKDNARSAKAMCEQVVELMSETGETLSPVRRPEEVSIYLPLHLPVDFRGKTILTIGEPPAAVKKGTTPQVGGPLQFAERVPWRKVVSVERVEIKTAPGKARWGVYRLGLE